MGSGGGAIATDKTTPAEAVEDVATIANRNAARRKEIETPLKTLVMPLVMPLFVPVVVPVNDRSERWTLRFKICIRVFTS
jgi:hypothetical protein